MLKTWSWLVLTDVRQNDKPQEIQPARLKGTRVKRFDQRLAGGQSASANGRTPRHRQPPLRIMTERNDGDRFLDTHTDRRDFGSTSRPLRQEGQTRLLDLSSTPSCRTGRSASLASTPPSTLRPIRDLASPLPRTARRRRRPRYRSAPFTRSRLRPVFAPRCRSGAATSSRAASFGSVVRSRPVGTGTARPAAAQSTTLGGLAHTIAIAARRR
jgi:hypothetical protein